MLQEFSLVPQEEERLKTWKTENVSRQDGKETADWRCTWWVTRSTVEIAVGKEEQWGLLKARLIFGLLSPALSLCGPTRDGKETVRSQHDYSAPAAFERGDRMNQKTLLCDRSRAQQSSLRAFVWKLVVIKLSHGWEEIRNLIFCASQNFVSHSDLEINDGTG